MAMSWTTLVGSKGSAGSIATWSNYSKLDTEVVLDEAQSLLFESLRCREMRTEWVFGIPVGNSNIALPTNFLDPIGRLYDITDGIYYKHVIETTVQANRAYDPSPAGAFGTNPFTTGAGAGYGEITSTLVSVNIVGNVLNQDATITIAGATVVDGINMNGTFPVISITDANDIVVDSYQTPTVGGVTGGGSASTWTANNLNQATPSMWSIWNERIYFDCAFEIPIQFKQQFFRAPFLLSSSNPTNWLTNRYPMLLRKATMTAAADFMKDADEYSKNLTALTTLIQNVNAEADLVYRGAEFGTDTP